MTDKTSPLFIAGVDEAGRGPLAGPVVAAAVILHQPMPGLADSKRLSAKQREAYFERITQSHTWSFAVASVGEIDQLNILNASLLAMQRALVALPLRPTHALVDGLHVPKGDIPAKAIVSGDASEPVISAASIVAKVIRDRIMLCLHAEYPQYELARHKGYPTKAHLALLVEHGLLAMHRRSFRPVAKILEDV